MKTSSAKAKGRRCAQEVKELILEYFGEFGLSSDDLVVTSSGDTGEDIKMSPLARDFLPISIECKNVERLNIWDALSQARSHSEEFEPVLFFRRNRSPLYVAIEAHILMQLLSVVARMVIDEKETGLGPTPLDGSSTDPNRVAGGV